MNVEFKRKQNRNYMIICAELQENGKYAAKMLSGNTIAGLIPFFGKQIDGETQYYYDITSKQPLERILMGRSITGDEIRQLVSAVIFTVSELERYFLDEDQLCLEPEYIYVEPDDFQCYLCLMPGRKVDFSEGFRMLAQYLLDHVNHDDSEAVVLAFGIFKQSQKINFGIEDIAKCLPRAEKRVDSDLNPEKEAVKSSEDSSDDLWETEFSRAENQYEEKTVSKQEKAPKRAGISGLLSAVISFFIGGRQNFKAEKIQSQHETSYDNEEFWEVEFREEGTAQIADDESDGGELQTVLLTAGPANMKNHYLIPLNGGTEIEIRYFPFIIGKSKTLSDFCINKPEVSRLHLKIEKNESGYQLLDLNSTNGTRVNGRLMEANETCELRVGDEISIASHQYRFC